MRKKYFPDEVLRHIAKKSIVHKFGGILARFSKPHYYECDSLRDYIKKIIKTKNKP